MKKNVFKFISFMTAFIGLVSCGETTTSTTLSTGSSLSSEPSQSSTATSSSTSSISQTTSSESSSSSIEKVIPDEIKTSTAFLIWVAGLEDESLPTGLTYTKTEYGSTSTITLSSTTKEIYVVNVDDNFYSRIDDDYYYEVDLSGSAQAYAIDETAEELDELKISTASAEERQMEEITSNFVTAWSLNTELEVGTSKAFSSYEVSFGTLGGYVINFDYYNDSSSYLAYNKSGRIVLNDSLQVTQASYDFASYSSANWDKTNHVPNDGATATSTRSYVVQNVKYDVIQYDEAHPLLDVTPYFATEITSEISLMYMNMYTQLDSAEVGCTISLDPDVQIVCLPNTALDFDNIIITGTTTPDLVSIDETGYKATALKAGEATITFGTVLHPSLKTFTFTISEAAPKAPVFGGLYVSDSDTHYSTDETNEYFLGIITMTVGEKLDYKVWTESGKYDYSLLNDYVTSDDGKNAVTVTFTGEDYTEEFYMHIVANAVGSSTLSIYNDDSSMYYKLHFVVTAA